MKIVVITRDGEYGDCPAYRKFCGLDRTFGSNYKKYIHSLIQNYVVLEDTEMYGQLIKDSSLPPKDAIEVYLADNNGKTVYEQHLKEKINTLLSECKPYATFTIDYGIEVNFVFVNEVFCKFLSSHGDYHLFVGSEHRKEFIEAICNDCEIEKNSANILYIHEKEWGLNAAKELMVNHKNVGDIPNDEFEFYKKYFKDIVAFQHIGSRFETICNLKFEVDKLAALEYDSLHSESGSFQKLHENLINFRNDII